MDNIFIQLAIILGLSSALGFITYKLKLPLLIAYLLVGLLIAFVGFFDVGTSCLVVPTGNRYRIFAFFSGNGTGSARDKKFW